MSRFSFREEDALKVSGLAAGVYGVHMLAAPRNAQDVYLGTGLNRSDTLTRIVGTASLNAAVTTLAVALSDGSLDAKRNALKGQALTWGICAAESAYEVHNKNINRDRGIANAVVQAGIAGVCLWKSGLLREKRV
eukprot:jgi/Chrzof1/3370/Cz12g22190.t1